LPTWNGSTQTAGSFMSTVPEPKGCYSLFVGFIPERLHPRIQTVLSSMERVAVLHSPPVVGAVLRATRELHARDPFALISLQGVILEIIGEVGLKLDHRLIVGASPQADSLDGVRRAEDGGAAAIVFRSLLRRSPAVPGNAGVSPAVPPPAGGTPALPGLPIIWFGRLRVRCDRFAKCSKLTVLFFGPEQPTVLNRRTRQGHRSQFPFATIRFARSLF